MGTQIYRPIVWHRSTTLLKRDSHSLEGLLQQQTGWLAAMWCSFTHMLDRTIDYWGELSAHVSQSVSNMPHLSCTQTDAIQLHEDLVTLAFYAGRTAV